MPADLHRFRYRLAGLDITSDLELLEGRSAVDGDRLDDPLVIESGARLGLPEPDGGNARSRDGRRVRLVMPGIGRFHIEDGRRVIAFGDRAVVVMGHSGDGKSTVRYRRLAYRLAQALAPGNADWWYLAGLTDTERAVDGCGASLRETAVESLHENGARQSMR